jgi:hypothetical protein
MKTLVVLSIAAGLGMTAPAQHQHCSDFNQNFPQGGYHNYGTAEHYLSDSGKHEWYNYMLGSCTYTGDAVLNVGTPCHPHSSSRSNIAPIESGHTFPYYWHVIAQNSQQGDADGPAGQTVTSDAEGAVAVSSCTLLPCGAPGISFSGGGMGGGIGVTYSPANPFWKDSHHYANACQGYGLPPLPATCLPNPTTPPYQLDNGYVWVWNTNTCTWEIHDPVTPLIIDTKGTGFKFGDPAKGQYVTFDMKGDNTYERISWPVAGSGNAWLVYDRDNDGIIKNGQELFGNFTPHSDGGRPDVAAADRNGFLALSWWDQLEQGGQNDFIIDRKDAIWHKLRLWIDEHCYKAPDSPCQSYPHELHTLESHGVKSISLIYGGGIIEDAAGNKFALHSVLNPDAEDKPRDEHGNSCCDLHQKSSDTRSIYDVWLKTVN